MGNWNTETAEWYAQKYGEYATNMLGIDTLNLRKEMTIVDIGCGTGSALRHAYEIVTEGTLIGVDPVPRMVEIAKEATECSSAQGQITFYEGAAEKLPLDEGIADCVLAFDSFDHWKNQALGLKEVSRILKPNGYFVVVKDGGLPEGDKAKLIFADLLSESGFRIYKEQFINESDVEFTLWICNLVH